MIPPEQDAAFVCAMETVLDTYQRPHDPDHPVVAVDEQPVQLVGEVRTPIRATPEHPQRIDSEYVRNGTANIFMVLEPLAGFREAIVTARRTAADFAEVLRHIAEDLHPHAQRITLVCDNLNTHGPACLYAAFDPARARAIAARIEWVHTPKHGSWLNVAECELSVLTRQCLSRRMPDIDTLRREVAQWQTRRDATGKAIDWQFTSADARIRLRRLYPQLPS